MLDYKKILNDLEKYKTLLGYKKYDLDIVKFKELSDNISLTRKECEECQQKRNAGADKIGKLVANKADKEEIIKVKEEISSYSNRAKELETKLREYEKQLKDWLMEMPNVPDERTPIGKDDSENKIEGYFGTKPEFDFTPLEHHVLGEKLDILDMERGAKLSGARFSILKGALARLDLAVKNFLMENAVECGYTPLCVPFMVGRNIPEGTGQLPKFEEEMFKTTSNGKELFLIPTAEVPVTNVFNGEVLKEEDLTISMCALTPCFRVEVGSAGRDIKGIFRQHQFDKLELVKFTHPDKSFEELERLCGNAMHALDKLNLHYRKVSLCTGDLGFGATHCYDIEVWLPGQQRYREISSCSNYLDFQARRANIRFQNKKTGKNEYIHTLNGSGLPVGRLLIAIMENYQQKDGSILIPTALKKFLPFEKIDTNGQLV